MKEAGGVIHTHTEISAATFDADKISLSLTDGEQLSCDLVIVQIGFLSAKDTFERLDLRLNEDGSIAIDPYFETSRVGVFGGRGRPRRHQAHHRRLGGRHPGGHLRLQGDHEPLLAQ